MSALPIELLHPGFTPVEKIEQSPILYPTSPIEISLLSFAVDPQILD